MNPARMIPALWLRLIVIIAFGLWVFTQHMWLIGAVSIVLGGLTIWQLVAAYRHRD
ncbi:hypothetical protein [Corynebacterium lowii]|uniref:Uncharacterized protein n=1 Tax=Corynebacterium lowii TaxID=1544413 RepID=A0A0Q0UCS4_9CORY|nr:hypothetical protein [Corynebacterium lowii]KQB85724.1 hypothetical protein Clow_01857 [Corynebacterium lowii]MDP9851026.1 general stress protein CsbA [Corynebacterium lowii]